MAGADKKNGYGRVYLKKQRRGPSLAHRVSWEIHRGPIPIGLIVRHICDNPSCVNPDHLKLGTHKDNLEDCRGRGRFGTKGSTKGEKHYCAKVDERAVKLLRLAAAYNVPKRKMAEIYGMSEGSMHRICNGTTWKHIPKEAI